MPVIASENIRCADGHSPAVLLGAIRVAVDLGSRWVRDLSLPCQASDLSCQVRKGLASVRTLFYKPLQVFAAILMIAPEPSTPATVLSRFMVIQTVCIRDALAAVDITQKSAEASTGNTTNEENATTSARDPGGRGPTAKNQFRGLDEEGVSLREQITKALHPPPDIQFAGTAVYPKRRPLAVGC